MIIEFNGMKYRDTGHNIGTPMPHFIVSTGSGKADDNLVKTVNDWVSYMPVSLQKTNKWICLETPEDQGIPPGLGTFVNSLKKIEFRIDLHIHNPVVSGSSNSAPSWLDKPATVCVDYKDSGNLNYYALGKSDILYFYGAVDDIFDEVWEDLKFVPCTRWLVQDYPYEDNTAKKDIETLILTSQGSRLTWVS